MILQRIWYHESSNLCLDVFGILVLENTFKNSLHKLSNGTIGRFKINQCIQQDSPLSTFLFLLVAQILVGFEGIKVLGRQFFFFNSEVIKVVHCTKEFSSISSLNKSLLFPLKMWFDLLLRCDYKIDKLTVKLPTFYNKLHY